MHMMSKADTKLLAANYLRFLSANTQIIENIKTIQEYNLLACHITGWYVNHEINCNNRTLYYNTLKKKFGKNSCQVMGWCRYTIWGIIATNGTKLIIETSKRGTSHGLDPASNNIDNIVEATKELHDYLLSKDRWELGT